MLSPEFLSAGRAVFTVSNPDGQRYTFKVSSKETDTGGAIYFAGLLTGPDNVSDYTYLGVCNPQALSREHTLRLTRKSRMNDDSLPVQVFRWAAWMIICGREIPAGYSIHHEGQCGRCGRALTVPESIETGLGPICAGKVDA